MQPILKPRVIAVHRRAAMHHDARTETQVDARIHARKSVLGRRVSDRPIVHRSATQIDLRIVKREHLLRLRHRAEVPGG
jgi:hypothetical protein